MKNYPELAMRTNKPGDEIDLYYSQLNAMAAVMVECITSLRKLDKVKASIMYGRDFTPADDDFIVESSARDKEILHAVLGIATEGGELLETLVGQYPVAMSETVDEDTGKAISCEIGKLNLADMNLVEEGGDVCWFMELMAQAIDTPVDEWKDRNVKKLQARFPDKYSDDSANSRDKEAEEKALS